MMAQHRPYPATLLDPDRTTGLIMCGMGGPDGPAAVEPFLRNLFADPAIFPVPRPLGPILGRFIAKVRAPGVRKRYLSISPDGATTQLPTTLRQGEELARRLSAANRRTVSGAAMRYWRPYPDETVTKMRARGAAQYLVVPTYPQYSSATNGSTLDFVLDSLSRLAPEAPVHVVSAWGLEPGYLAALARPVRNSLTAWAHEGVDPAHCAWVSVAHALPRKLVDRGDPYLDQTLDTVTAVHGAVQQHLADQGHAEWFAALPGGTVPLLAFQSRVGPIRWLGPEITRVVRGLAHDGCRHLHVQPVSFTCEHIETLVELDRELKEKAISAGVGEYRRGAALNLDGGWLDSMAGGWVDSIFQREDALA
ncbi:ferrochelatase [bacterium]|nr:MAG: ferrochelatase [bacterium]